MVELRDDVVPRPSSSPDSVSPPALYPEVLPPVDYLTATPRPTSSTAIRPDDHRPLPRSGPSRRIPRTLTNQADLVSKINLLDLATEITAVIFRYAHKPKDFHYLIPSGAGPLIHRKYNLPLAVSKEWYRRVLPIYFETLRLTWLKLPDFVENMQRYSGLNCYVQSIHVKIVGKSLYKVIRSHEAREEARTGVPSRVSPAQQYLLVSQYIDAPLSTFALCLDMLNCVKDLTLRFTECKGGEVTLQTIASIIANLPPSVQNLWVDSANVAMQTLNNPYPVHICPIIRKHGTKLKSLFLSSRFLCHDLFHPDLIPNWEPPEDLLSSIDLLSPLPSYPNLESFTIYREGRYDPSPKPCSEMYLFGDKDLKTSDDWPREFIDYAVQAHKRGSFPSIKRFEIPSNSYHPNGKPCSSVFDVLQDDNYWNSNEEIVIDEEVGDEDEGWSVPERWWRSKRRGMDKR